MKVVKVLGPAETASEPHALRRVVVLQRDDGLFTHAEEYFYRTEYEGVVMAEGWARLGKGGICDTAEHAEAEGRAEFARIHKCSL